MRLFTRPQLQCLHEKARETITERSGRGDGAVSHKWKDSHLPPPDDAIISSTSHWKTKRHLMGKATGITAVTTQGHLGTVVLPNQEQNEPYISSNRTRVMPARCQNVHQRSHQRKDLHRYHDHLLHLNSFIRPSRWRSKLMATKRPCVCVCES